MKKDRLIRGLLFDGQVNLMAIEGTRLIKEAQDTHWLSRVCTAALGRTLMMCSMMGRSIKHEQGKVTVLVRGGGPAGNIVCTAFPDASVKGYIENPKLELPLAPNGKLDVSMAVGWFGELTVIKDLGMKEPYIGRCQLVSGEIAEDFAQYFTVSEQQPSLVYLGVRVDASTGAVLAGGGLTLSPMPNCPDDIIDALQAKAEEISGLSKRLEQGESLDSILKKLFKGMKLELTDETEPLYRCDCSRERLTAVLVALGREELEDMLKKDGEAKLTCQFCNKTYIFDGNELKEILKLMENKDA